ncbi:MAG: thiamine pyrophosphate-dependent enzyme, partial [Halobacteria archaeon]|nr:thiamine pyrophosphate-dependent enzyme [Halobacteria archaeon]
LVFVGCSTNTTLWKHEKPLVPDDATLVHVSDDAHELGKNHPADVAVLGDPGTVAGELADEVSDALDPDVLEERLESVESTKEVVGEKMESMGVDESDSPLPSKAELVDALRDATPDAFLVDEGVTAKYALLTRFDLEARQWFANKGGGLGYGLPASVGAAIAHDEVGSERDVVGFVGDGSYLYYPQSVFSAVREGVDLTVVVSNNRNYRILKDNTLDIFGGNEDDYDFVGMDIEPRVNVPANAESYGATARRVESEDELDEALTDAVGGGVDVVDVLVHD